MSGYGSPLTVYLQKKNLVPKGETSRAAHRGKILEPMIRMETMKDLQDVMIEPLPAMLYDPEFPFMAANLDGVIRVDKPVEIRGQTIEGLGGHEIKSAKTNYGWGEDEIPDSYYCQVQHYMRVTGLPWFVVSAYILDDETLCHYVINRNEDFIARLVAAEKDFWENYVRKDIMPAPVGIENEDDMITGMFDGSSGPIALTDEEVTLCQKHKDLSNKIKELETQKDATGIELKAKLITRANPDRAERKLSASGGGYSVSWSFFQRTSADSDALKKAGIFERYCKTIETDRMTITAKKKGA
jgi:predicted phage-related endonuclease